MKSTTFAQALGLALLFVEPAQAQSPVGESPSAQEGSSATDYSYVFTDDPLAATPESAAGLRLTVRRGSQRTYLIRARAHFIRELFQSAEDL